MNVWLVGAWFLLLAQFPCAVAVCRGRPLYRLAGLEMAGVVQSLMLILLAQGLHRIPLYDLAVCMALLSFGAGLVFARFLERWL